MTIVTNAGGPGVLAADALVKGGGKLTELSPETYEALNNILPAHWSHNNPIDILGDATPQAYAKTLEIAAADSDADALLVILTPQSMTNPTLTAEALAPYAKRLGKPVLASWMGGPTVRAGREVLQKAAIPTFEHPDDACRAFNLLWRYSDNLELLNQLPSTFDDPDVFSQGRSAAQRIVQAVRQEKRTLLNEFESKQLLEAYGIPTVKTRVAQSVEEALSAAEEIGFPVVLKLYSNTITHKTDVGGVKLNLTSSDEVRAAYDAIKSTVTEKAGAKHFGGVTVQQMISLKGYEIILGSSVDPQFGPVLLFGAGGQLVEVFKDRSLGLPPLTATLARRMMERTKIYKALKGVRGEAPVDLGALEQLMVRFSHIASQEAWIAEIDINPLLVSPQGMIALDARVVLHDVDSREEDLPSPAIRPYPVQYISKVTSGSGLELQLRPIRAEDESLLVEFHKSLSEQTIVNRYHTPYDLHDRVARQRLVRICFGDYARELALIAIVKVNNNPEIAGVCRIRRNRYTGSSAEFALVVSDKYQSQGVGKELLAHTITAARTEGITHLGANVLSSNQAGIHLCRKMGFVVESGSDAEHCRVNMELS